MIYPPPPPPFFLRRAPPHPPPHRALRARSSLVPAHSPPPRTRSAALPGQAVHVASDDLLQAFFSNDVRAGMEVGTLITRDSVPVLLDPNGLRRHLAVIAQTGAGKSYLVGKVLESLLDLGGTILVFDPNSDYV